MDDDVRFNGAIEWLEKAEGDLTVARLIHDHGGPAELGCYHCQQAVEKLLKAIMVFAGKRLSRTHDLTALHRLVSQIYPTMDIDEGMLERLADYAVAPRYPGFDATRSESDLEPFITFCDQLVPKVRSLFDASD